MTRASWWVALVLALTLAGCLASMRGADPPGLADEGSLPAFAGEGCSVRFGAGPVPRSLVDDELPPGFALDNPLADTQGEIGMAGFYFFTCATGAQAAEPLERPAAAFAFLRVAPPPSWTDAEAAAHFLVLDLVVSDVATLNASRAAGFGVARDGSVEVGPDAGASGTARARTDDAEYLLRTWTTEPERGEPLHDRFFTAAAGEVTATKVSIVGLSIDFHGVADLRAVGDGSRFPLSSVEGFALRSAAESVTVSFERLVLPPAG